MQFGPEAVFLLGLLLALGWLALAATMPAPRPWSNRAWGLPAHWQDRAAVLEAKIATLPGVVEARVSAPERALYLKVDPSVFDEATLRGALGSGKPGSEPHPPQ
jgi:hypothetical protein